MVIMKLDGSSNTVTTFDIYLYYNSIKERKFAKKVIGGKTSNEKNLLNRIRVGTTKLSRLESSIPYKKCTLSLIQPYKIGL